MSGNRAESKPFIRETALRQRDALSGEMRSALDAELMQRLFTLESFVKAHMVLLYASFRTEVGTLEIIERSIKAKKTVVLPKVVQETASLTKHVINGLHEVSPGYMGIPEPTTAPGHKAEEMDALVIPGVAFDEKGARVGYGGGYYDRLLPRVKGVKPIIALAYEQQMFEEGLPTEEHDVAMDFIVTPERIIRCHG